MELSWAEGPGQLGNKELSQPPGSAQREDSGIWLQGLCPAGIPAAHGAAGSTKPLRTAHEQGVVCRGMETSERGDEAAAARRAFPVLPGGTGRGKAGRARLAAHGGVGHREGV